MPAVSPVAALALLLLLSRHVEEALRRMPMFGGCTAREETASASARTCGYDYPLITTSNQK